MAAMHVGPRSLDPMAGYRPDWQPGPAMPRSAGIGPWRPVLVVVGLGLLVVNLLGGGPSRVPRAQADTFAGPSLSCVTADHTLAQFDMTGYQFFGISFKLTIHDGGPVRGAWQTSVDVGNSYWPSPHFWSGGGVGSADATWYVYSTTADGTSVGLDGNRSGIVQYVIGKASNYGGCFDVSNVVITRTPSQFNGQESPDPSWTPPPSWSPSPAPSTPGGGPWDYTKCTGTEVSSCATPPAGWCWVGELYYMRIIPCEASSPAPTPTPGQGLNGTATCTTSYNGVNWKCSAAISLPLLDGDEVTAEWTRSAAGANASSNQARITTASDGAVVVPANPGCGNGAGLCSYIHNTNAGVPNVYSTTATLTADEGTPFLYVYNAGPGSGAATTWSVSLTITGGPSYEAAPSPSYEPYPQPSGFPNPSGLNTGPGGLGGPIDQCEGPDDAGLFMCGDGTITFPSFNVQLCPSGSDLAICQEVSPSQSFTYGVPDASGALAGFEALASNAAGRVPFGIVAQVGDALGGAANDPGGPAMDWCADIPVPVIGNTVETCIPTDTFEALTPWRPLLVGIVWLGTALALFRVARGSVGQTDATG